ncbi:Myb/SANT-like DNA-binding domain-containing protein [Camponotus japonicus]
MNDLFGTKPWIQPVAVAGSNIIIDELEEPSSHQAIKGKLQKENKHASSYKQRVLDYTKSRAEQRDKQHKEKMDLLFEIKNLMNQVIEKE